MVRGNAKHLAVPASSTLCHATRPTLAKGITPQLANSTRFSPKNSRENNGDIAKS